MSRSPSPASSLDFFESDVSEDEAYTPQKRTVTKKKTVPAAGGKKGGAGGPTIRINLRAAAAAQDAAAQYPMDGDIEVDEELEEGDAEGIVGRRGIDLSGQELVRDHEIRPLWVDELGNMYVNPLIPSHPPSQMEGVLTVCK